MEDKNQCNRDLKQRTKQFALDVIKFCSSLPQNNTTKIIGNQLLKSGTSVGANYRESCRARSNAEFISKLSIALQELEETAYWIELLEESKVSKSQLLHPLYKEVDELTSILISIIKKVKAN